ncbi:MAG: hypothetical protein PHP95_13415 [Desulfuromonadaceae bacterium]|nr:hypothetical protein [Desulfuromonadaceae bacterium]MDD2849445.1 hypothetical protein [Desulfuromonadaceae bacterium]MDD4130541.1 hypothetical protein [Desulfuromonadaceae bacterium]
MIKTILKIAAILFGMWVLILVGYRVGSQKTSDYFLRQAMESELTSLRTNIKVAEQLKSNQKEKAEELLETLIDVDVSSLGVQVNQKTFAPMRKEILASINEAKVYRTKWTSPTHTVNKNLKSGVDAAFGMDNVQLGGGTQLAR